MPTARRANDPQVVLSASTPAEGVISSTVSAGTALAVPDAHLIPTSQVAEILDVDPVRGLDDAQVSRRLGAVGPNRLAEPVRRAAWRRFLDQFRSLLILILIAAAVLAGLVGDVKDTVVITVVLLINATIGFVQENRAERSLEALRKMLTPTARVRRDELIDVIDAGDLVPGDIVLLEAGDRVPADGRLLVAESVEIDESALTGESQPVSAAQLDAQVVAVAKGLVAMGIEPGDLVGIMARTRYEWTLLDFAIWVAGAVSVPLYETSSSVSTAESVRRFGVLPGDMTEENGYLTPKQSVRRGVFVKDFAAHIDDLYDPGAPDAHDVITMRRPS